jgi:hypothetical protein
MRNTPASIIELITHSSVASAYQKLAVFCYSFNPDDIKEMQYRISEMTDDNPDKLGRARLLDYLEALETILPALHEIHREIYPPKTEIYTKLVACKRRFSSLKRRPD